MGTKDFNWMKGDLIQGKTVIVDATPDRATLAETNIIVDKEEEVILLIDPHSSGTWENWMFPYSSLILQKKQLEGEFPEADFLKIDSGSNLNDVAESLDQILSRYHENYIVALRNGINQVIPELVNAMGTIVSVDYSLKFSKTSDSYTAYRFEGKKIITDKHNIHVHVPFIWLPQSTIIDIDDDEKIEGKLIAKNVKETLSNMRF
jgi:hypothetical protein